MIRQMFLATPGLAVEVLAPQGTNIDGVPAASVVVAWAVIDDGDTPGGARLDPVFLAAGQAWTPSQYRAAYGENLTVCVRRAV
ncbi:hypothetical protein [Streptomyces zhihengii]